MLLQEVYGFNVVFIVYRTKCLKGIPVSYVYISIEKNKEWIYAYNYFRV